MTEPLRVGIRERIRRSELVRNSVWMLAGHGLRLVLQGAYFVLVARALGPAGYGAFSAALALAAILAPYSSLGGGNLMIRDVAHAPEFFRSAWGRAIRLTLASGAALLITGVPIALTILPGAGDWLMVLSVFVAELWFARLLEISGQAFQAVRRLRETAQLQVLLSAVRLAAAIVLLFGIGGRTPVTWSVLYLASTVVAGVTGVILVSRRIGRPESPSRVAFADLREGFYFSLSMSAQSVYNDIDKTVLARMDSFASAGTYAAAYRIVDVSFAPVTAMLAAAYPRFFKDGRSGVRSGARFAKKLLFFAIPYTLLSGAVLFICAPLLPIVLGSEYTQAVQILPWLAPIPVLRAIHYFGADTLTGSGRQGMRSAIQAGTAILSAGLNVALVPTLGWQGAAGSSLAAHAVLAAALWCAVAMLLRRERETSAV